MKYSVTFLVIGGLAGYQGVAGGGFWHFLLWFAVSCIALAFLAERGRIRSYEEGISLIKAARPGVALNKTQERFIRDYIAGVRDTQANP